MMMPNAGRNALVASLLAVWVVSVAPALSLAEDLRVMCFNIRNSNAKDGEDAWPKRRALVVRTIESFNPDLLGLQETQPDQRDALQEALGKTYAFIGVGRDDGRNKGEIASVIFRRDRFEKVRDGHFWLSETPEVVGSKGWDAAITRICTWVELKDRTQGGKSLFVFNTHYDHKGIKARPESSKLLRRQVERIAGEAPTIVMGDFNSHENSPAQQTLLAGGLLSDTYADLHKSPTTQDFTFHGFTGRMTGQRAHRIDWILRSDDFTTREASINKSHGENGRYPSDHFPVTAVLEWEDGEAAGR